MGEIQIIQMIEKFENRILCGDCLKVMKDMQDKSVDLIWTDPPYNIGKDYGVYKDNLSDQEYIKFTKDWLKESDRISLNMGLLVPTKHLLKYWTILGSAFRQIVLTWTHSGGIRYGFANQFASVLINKTPNKVIQNNWINVQMPGSGYFFRENSYGHPGYTSYDLTSRIIKYFTIKGDIVFDPFIGTGTTAVAAKQLERNFVGIEINPDYCKIAEQRLAQTELFMPVPQIKDEQTRIF